MHIFNLWMLSKKWRPPNSHYFTIFHDALNIYANTWRWWTEWLNHVASQVKIFCFALPVMYQHNPRFESLPALINLDLEIIAFKRWDLLLVWWLSEKPFCGRGCFHSSTKNQIASLFGYKYHKNCRWGKVSKCPPEVINFLLLLCYPTNQVEKRVMVKSGWGEPSFGFPYGRKQHRLLRLLLLSLSTQLP